MPTTNEDEHKKEYLALLAVFEKFIDSLPDDINGWDIMEELMNMRSMFLIHHAMNGLGVHYNTALDILRTDDTGLNDYEKSRRNVIIAIIDNMVDFAVAEEYQMRSDIYNVISDEPREDDLDIYIDIFDKYNDRYARIENLDVEYATVIAAQIIAAANTTEFTYMTQGDERVRPWHLQYEGFSATKANFPAWLVPPIEHACRCYLVEDTVHAGIEDVHSAINAIPDMPEWFNKTFKECVAFGGKIFSEDHPYFDVASDHAKKLQDIAYNIKEQYRNGKKD